MKHIVILCIFVGIAFSQKKQKQFLSYGEFKEEVKKHTNSDEERLVESFRFLFKSDKSKLKKSHEHVSLKCITPLMVEYEKVKGKLSESSKKEIRKAKGKPGGGGGSPTTYTYLSASGKFELSYELSGSNAVPSADANNNNVPDYIENCADYFDYSHQVEVTNGGYQNPILSGQTYKVSFQALSYYGYTSVSGGTTYIVMHNDFADFPANTDPDGNVLGAAKVTAAHEYKHAVQYATTGWNEAGSWVELDATWAEDFVYDDTNDYYNYLTSSSCQLKAPTTSMNNDGSDSGSYYDAIWQLYLTEKYGNQFMLDLWNRRKNTNESYLNSYSAMLASRGATIEDAIAEYTAWNMMTGTRATNIGYGESADYNMAPLSGTLSSSNSSEGTRVTHWASNLFEIQMPSNGSAVSLNLSHSKANFRFMLVSKASNGSGEILPINFSGTSGQYTIPSSYATKDFVGLVAVNTSTSRNRISYSVDYAEVSGFSASLNQSESSQNPKFGLVQNYPNPFNPTTTISYALDESGPVRLSIFNTIGQEVATLVNTYQTPSSYHVTWDASNVSSGIYFYRLTTNKKTAVKQMILMK